MIEPERTPAEVAAGTSGDIGWAVREMRYHGGKVRRRGWNGKGLYLVFQKGYPDGIPINANTAQATGVAQGTVCKFLPYVMMCTVDGSFVPWLCSQSDLLANDWELAVPFKRESACPAHDTRCTPEYCILDPHHPQRRPNPT